MKRIDLINQIINRKEQLGITVENLAKLSGVGVRTINRLLKNEDVKLSTIEHVTNFLGLDFAGNEQIPVNELKKQRAHEKALFLASIVQGTSALEMQGLEDDSLNRIIATYEKEFLDGEYKNTLWVA
ncbi:helix-turn-helix transcriptional regulator [Candidatus Sulfurimonas marisnigri]|uniref:Helix-turn-helix transcriptional regulator n=1 Tax=Candidatus Sulfurimonas marisnigri TaxID=2740405 RepID=A0A7S7M222_9BACT|nr:helix-turn-helix domain-containing protein [Candidatus Sulfurimonas marisnigri]QOY55697.1 helix-turn-helix transcriptional regulator [Candidatus Sulfurimonas marisnigri]